jgi:TetR/AcrR family fatty acid metabolism transcriptional regulator
MTTAATPPTKRRRREETRQRLLDSALAVFAQHGYERATVDEIVREAGFSKGAFYVHFESKEDLFWEMLQARIAAQQEALRQAMDLSAPTTELRVLTAIFDVEKQDRSWPAMYMEFAAHAARNEKVRERLSVLYERWHSFTVEMLKAGQAAGRVRTDQDVEFMASVLIAVIEGSMMQSRLAPQSVRLSEMVEPLSRLLMEWLGATPPR